jgi:hypothetical protein
VCAPVLTNTNPRRQFRADFCCRTKRRQAPRTKGAIAGGARNARSVRALRGCYEDRNRLGVIVARTGRGGFEAYAADDHSLGLFPTPRAAAAAITMARPWVERMRTNTGPS